MSNLKDKKIKIDGKKYLVRDQFTNNDEGIETIVLTRPIKGFKPRVVDNLSDLGYEDEDDVVYTDAEMNAMDDRLQKEIGSVVDITMILNSGVLSDTEVEIVGATWGNPDSIDIVFLDKDKEPASISRELLFKSCLLWQERNAGFKPDREESSGKDELDKVLGDLTGLLDDIMQKGKSGNTDNPHDLLEKILGDKKGSRPFGRPYGKEKVGYGRPPMPYMSNMPEGFPDILKDVLDSKNTSVTEIDLDDAPEAIQELLRSLKNGRR